MKNLGKCILRGTSILGLVLTAASTSSAMTTSGATGPRETMDPAVMAWRAVARKNFIEGFCVAQNLNAQKIVIQPNQQVDQATVNAFKIAVAACKPGNKNTVTATPAPSPIPSSAQLGAPTN